MSEEKRRIGTVTVVAKTGGIKLDNEDKWYNPTNDAKPFVLQEMKGKRVELTMNKEGKFKGIIVLDEIESKMQGQGPMNEAKTEQTKQKSTKNDEKCAESTKNTLKTVNIKGKRYVMVNERIKEFRRVYKTYSLISEIVENNSEYVIFKASILNEVGIKIATGHAMEKSNSSMINKTSHLENCETSAWGRALGNFGIGIDNFMASADEVAIAIQNRRS